MIMFLFVLAALGFFYHRVLDQHDRARTIGTIVTGAVIVASVLAIAANDVWHVGMHEHTTSQTTALVGNQVAAIAIGTNKHEQAYVARLASGKTVTVKPGLTTTTALNTNAAKARLVTSKTVLRFDNPFAAIMFAGSGLQNKRVATHVTVHIPNTWRISQR
ncbi:DUF4811 domain-containing protein [Lacticaseibacillus sp. GG6-2]